MRVLACRDQFFIADALSKEPRQQWDNSAHLMVLVDKIPEYDELVYTKRGGHYYAEKDGYVKFHYHSGNPKRQEGYGGAVFHLKLDDGTETDLIGPWSSNSGSMNQQGFGPCLEVSITDEPQCWERGYTFYAGAITVELALQALKVWERPPQLRKSFNLALAFDGAFYTPVLTKSRGLDNQLLSLDALKDRSASDILLTGVSREQADIITNI